MFIGNQAVNKDVVLEEVKKQIGAAGQNDVWSIGYLPSEGGAIRATLFWTDGQYSLPSNEQMQIIVQTRSRLEATGFAVEYTSWYSPRAGSDDPFGNLTGHGLKLKFLEL